MFLFAVGIAMTWAEFEIAHGGNAQTIKSQNFCIVALIVTAIARFFLPLRELVVMVTTVGSYTLLDSSDAAYANAFADELQQHVSAAKRSNQPTTDRS